MGSPYDDVMGLFGMWVAPSGSGSEIGMALIQALIDWTRTQGHAILRLDVRKTNRHAIALYERAGFLRNGVETTLPPPRTHIEEFQMELQV